MAKIAYNSYGFGSTINIPSTGQLGLKPVFIGETSITNTLETTEIDAFPIVGSTRLERYRELDSSSTWELAPSIATGNDYAMSILLGEYEQEEASYARRKKAQGVVDNSNEIVDPELVGLAITDVLVSREASDTTEALYFKVGTGVPTATDEVQLDSATGKLVFNTADHIGSSIIYSKNIPFSNVKTFYSGSSPTAVGSLFFDGVVTFGDSSYYTVLPSLKRTGDVSMTVGAELTLDVTLTAQLAQGFRQPIVFVNVSDEDRAGLI